jgi:hypothetical protein
MARDTDNIEHTRHRTKTTLETQWTEPASLTCHYSSCQIQTVYDNILKERNTLSKSVKIQSTIIKQQTENMKEIKDENFQLKNYLKTQRKELTVLNEITLRNQIEQVKNRNSELLRKTKLVTELRWKSTFQTKKNCFLV